MDKTKATDRQTCGQQIMLRPARRKLIRRGKKSISKEGGGGNDHYQVILFLHADSSFQFDKFKKIRFHSYVRNVF